MGHRFAANGNKEQQFVGLLGENLFKTIIGLYPTFEDGFDGRLRHRTQWQEDRCKDNG